jgi:hypothetical protein
MDGDGEEMSWEDTGGSHGVGVIDAADGGAFHARLPFEVVRRYVDARGGGRLPDQLLAALELSCAYCAGLALPAPYESPCAFCHGARVWRLPWRGHASADGTIQVSSRARACTSMEDMSIHAPSIFLFLSHECYTRARICSLRAVRAR